MKNNENGIFYHFDCLFVSGLSESRGALDLVYPITRFRFSRPSVALLRPENQSDAGQILTLRRDSSMADRRALSLSFFKKPCVKSKGGQTDEKQRERRRDQLER